MVLWTARRLSWFCVNRIPICKHTNFQLVKINVVAEFPVFLLPALLDHVMSFFFVVRSYSISVGAIRKRQQRFNAWQRIYILVCTDWLVLSEVYISLFVRIGLFCPNKVLTPVYEWIYTLQLTLSSAMRMYAEITHTRCKFNSIMMNNGPL